MVLKSSAEDIAKYNLLTEEWGSWQTGAVEQDKVTDKIRWLLDNFVKKKEKKQSYSFNKINMRS